MKTSLRTLVAILLAPIWAPFALVTIVVMSPLFLIAGIDSLFGFVITGDWHFDLPGTE